MHFSFFDKMIDIEEKSLDKIILINVFKVNKSPFGHVPFSDDHYF